MPIPSNGAANGTSSPRPKILIPEKVSPDGLALLQSSFEVDEKRGLSAEELQGIIADYDGLIIRSETKVTASLLDAAKKLKVVARAGVGIDNVDVEAATKNGVIVVNSPVGNINAAAEHTIALMMAVARNIGDACASLKAGKWERSRLTGIEVKGKTLAIIGVGKVGLTVARAAKGLGMNCIAYDPYANQKLAAAASVKLLPGLASILTEADFLTIHTPLIASTKGMIGAAELATMKPSARILNVARGGMIDETALLAALEAGSIAGAGIDVFTSEPPPSGADSSAARLIAHPKVVATPHLGASTVEAQENVSIDVCEQVRAILTGELPRSAVNAPIILPEEYRTLKPFVELVERMGALYMQHFARTAHSTGTTAAGSTGPAFSTDFELAYEGALAGLNTTKPLFAALVKGLLKPITDSEGLNVNMVNAELVARDRGIAVNEQRRRQGGDAEGYSSSVVLRARTGASGTAGAGAGAGGQDEHVIAGFVSNNTPYISKLSRFSTSFVPEGALLICRNFDSPGKIGIVGQRLGKAGVNISSMTVAPVDKEIGQDEGKDGKNEALMILKIDREVEDEVIKNLISEEGVLEASVVVL
ncbi:phosphoglycerate dehydrogenase [Viridothelium virens]|uniref:D-3-phosphoglycerate dehydrogenase n=1 Tax=Viridothelium virens TaxID=1048519 RepID=A0A6A6HP11_VIRVR|nr:phosphoglycerate dehydrogenase [Viridothelium virens]